MQISIILALLLTGVSLEPLQRKQWRIINGTAAAKGQIPYQAGVFTDLGNFCGAFIYKNCVITAAHCLTGVKYGRIIYGTTEVYAKNNYQNFTSSGIEIHGLWNRPTLRDDIGLIKMNEKLPTSTLIQSAQLSCSASASSSCGTSQTILVSGWGKTSDSSPISTRLQYAEMLILSSTYCNKRYNIKLTDRQLCVGSSGKTSTCSGDSGSPGVSTSTTAVCGLVSFGDAASCEIGTPNVFTKISPYCDWIEQACH